MTLQWEPMALPGLVVGSVELVLAVVIYASRPDRPQNRVLAAFFALAFVVTGGGWGARLFFDDPVDATALLLVALAALQLWMWAYLSFLGTIPSPLSRPLRVARVRWALGLYFVPVAAAYLLDGWNRVREVRPFTEFDGWSVGIEPPWFAIPYLLWGIWAYGIAVAVTAYRSATSPTLRRQAMWYMSAFVWQDTLALVYNVAYFWETPSNAAFFEYWTFIGPAVASGGLEVFIAYGILKTQLFDIDLKIKWTLNRGTVAAVFVAAFFAVSEIASGLLSERIGLVAGVLATALLVFAIAPLQRFAERVSDAAMPRVQDTAEYRMVRKREVYRAAVESAMEDGDVTPKERSMLATLQDQLGLSAKDALAIERDAARGAT